MKSCLFIFVLSLVTLVNARGVKLGIARGPKPMSGLSVGNGNTFSWKSCASDNSMAAINSLDVSLDGYVASVAVDVSLGEEVSGGTVSVAIYYNGFKLGKYSISLCSIVKQAGQSCPISEGDYKETAEFNIPNIPCGSYAGTVSATDQNGNSLGCVSFEMEINC